VAIVLADEPSPAAEGALILVVLFATGKGTWERSIGFALCALAAFFFVTRGEWDRLRKWGWNMLALSLAIVVVANVVHTRPADLALYAIIGACLFAGIVILYIVKPP
jgi:hypothetical protein